MNALDQVRLRGSTPYVGQGQAPDQSWGGLGMQYGSVNANASVGGAVGTTGVLLLAIVAVVLFGHVLAR